MPLNKPFRERIEHHGASESPLAAKTLELHPALVLTAVVPTVKIQCREVDLEDDHLRKKQFLTMLGMPILVPKSNQLQIGSTSHRIALTELFQVIPSIRRSSF